ncbi:MAG: ferrochelatase, partial [Gammaproteobacteria bacterium]|nr:ferrochelatase [Gammaproteobacteria bacterium]
MNNQPDNIRTLAHKKVILLVNLGSPELLTVGAIRKFLSKFLSDKRVINLPRILWYPILYGIILLLRPSKLLVQYNHIWHKGHSPLVYYTKLQAQKLQALINDDGIVVKYAFSYSTPHISEALAQIHANYTVDKLIIIPLYPQFSSTTTMAVFDHVSKFYQDKFYLPQVCYINSFYNNKLYIKALAQSILDSWATHSRHEKLIFSYHGLPIKAIQRGDAYFEQCLITTGLVA